MPRVRRAAGLTAHKAHYAGEHASIKSEAQRLDRKEIVRFRLEAITGVIHKRRLIVFPRRFFDREAVDFSVQRKHMSIII